MNAVDRGDRWELPLQNEVIARCTLARVIPGDVEATTLGRIGAADVFVTTPKDIAGLNAAQIS